MGKFVINNTVDLNNIPEKLTLPESDFSIHTQDNKFIQFKYISDEDLSPSYKVKPGIFSIDVAGGQYFLTPAEFTNDRILNEYTTTKDISDKINIFFNKISVYEELGVFPKRGLLLYGSPGQGKTQSIAKIAMEHVKNKDTLVVIWKTDKHHAQDIKTFLKSFKYPKTVKKFIFIAEDIGGVEYTQRGKMLIDSGLLSLLDNVEKAFQIPTFIIATTNYPENLLTNLTDRPQRFDDKLEVKPPSAEFRSKFLEFFSQNQTTNEEKIEISKKEYEGLSVAHIKEIVIRARLYDLTILDSLKQIKKQSKDAQNDFAKEQTKLGIY